MVIVTDRKDYLVKTRVNIGHFFGAQPEDGFVELVEPDTFETNRMTKASKEAQASGDSSALMQHFRELMPKIIVDHTLYKTETEKHTPEEVADIIFAKVDLVSYVIDHYSKEVLFTLGKKSDEN